MFNEREGYGFVQDDAEAVIAEQNKSWNGIFYEINIPNIYVPDASLCTEIRPGDLVEFEIGEGNKGRIAINVSALKPDGTKY